MRCFPSLTLLPSKYLPSSSGPITGQMTSSRYDHLANEVLPFSYLLCHPLRVCPTSPKPITGQMTILSKRCFPSLNLQPSACPSVLGPFKGVPSLSRVGKKTRVFFKKPSPVVFLFFFGFLGFLVFFGFFAQTRGF